MVMDKFANQVIDALGGTTKVATHMSAPVSTVHSWRKNGIPPSRLSHLKYIAAKLRIKLPKEEEV